MEENKKQPQTYIGIGSQENGSLEFDLIAFREKGQQVRYLSITFSGNNPKTGESQESFINIDEEAFNTVKDFFRQLEWNS